MPIKSRFIWLALAGSAVAACSDLPTTPPVQDQIDQKAAFIVGQVGTPKYVCFSSERRPTEGKPFRYTRTVLHFSGAETAADGQTREFMLRVASPGREPVIAANCRIPATRAAAERLYRSFARMVGHGATLSPFHYAGADAPRNLFVSEKRRSRMAVTDPRRTGGDPCSAGCYFPLTAYGGPNSPLISGGGYYGYEGGWGSQGDTYSSGGGDYATPPPVDSEIDTVDPGDTLPDCSLAQSRPWQAAYCRATAPTDGRLQKTQDALARIAQRGPDCATIAQKGSELLASGELRYYTWTQGDAGGWGRPDFGAMLADFWADNYATVISPDGRNLDQVLAHEVEHTMGLQHIDAGGYETPHSHLCSGLP